MTIFLILAGSLTCGFFLYVLVQFHGELRRRELHTTPGHKPRQRHSPTLRFRSRGGRDGRSFEAAMNSARVPLAETAVSVKLLVPRDT
jgi:hypothetical protein